MTDGDAQAPPAAKPTLRQRLAALFSEYGSIAIGTYLALSLLAIIGFSIAFAVGTGPESATGFIGVVGAGWLAAKATMPVRILLTLALTPAVGWVMARLGHRRRGAAADVPGAPRGTE